MAEEYARLSRASSAIQRDEIKPNSVLLSSVESFRSVLPRVRGALSLAGIYDVHLFNTCRDNAPTINGAFPIITNGGKRHRP